MLFSDLDGEMLSLKTEPIKLLELKGKVGGSEIVCCGVSRCGGWVAYFGTQQCVRLYNLTTVSWLVLTLSASVYL